MKKYKLRSEVHAVNLDTSVHRLLAKNKFIDVTLACDGQKIRCHRLVLAAASPLFEELLVDNPTFHPTVIMPMGLKASTVKTLIDFMYTGEANVSKNGLSDLVKSAEVLQVHGLFDGHTDIREYISEDIEEEQVEEEAEAFDKNFRAFHFKMDRVREKGTQTGTESEATESEATETTESTGKPGPQSTTGEPKEKRPRDDIVDLIEIEDSVDVPSEPMDETPIEEITLNEPKENPENASNTDSDTALAVIANDNETILQEANRMKLNQAQLTTVTSIMTTIPAVDVQESVKQINLLQLTPANGPGGSNNNNPGPSKPVPWTYIHIPSVKPVRPNMVTPPITGPIVPKTNTANPWTIYQPLPQLGPGQAYIASPIHLNGNNSAKPSTVTAIKSAPIPAIKAAPIAAIKPAPMTTLKAAPITSIKPAPMTTIRAAAFASIKPAPMTTIKSATIKSATIKSATIKSATIKSATIKSATITSMKPAPMTTIKAASFASIKPAPMTTMKPAPITSFLKFNSSSMQISVKNLDRTDKQEKLRVVNMALEKDSDNAATPPASSNQAIDPPLPPPQPPPTPPTPPPEGPVEIKTEPGEGELSMGEAVVRESDFPMFYAMIKREQDDLAQNSDKENDDDDENSEPGPAETDGPPVGASAPSKAVDITATTAAAALNETEAEDIICQPSVSYIYDDDGDIKDDIDCDDDEAGVCIDYDRLVAETYGIDPEDEPEPKKETKPKKPPKKRQTKPKKQPDPTPSFLMPPSPPSSFSYPPGPMPMSVLSSSQASKHFYFNQQASEDEALKKAFGKDISEFGKGLTAFAKDIAAFAEAQETPKRETESHSPQTVVLRSPRCNQPRHYSTDSLYSALMAVKHGESIYRASRQHAVPRKTLRNWMKRWDIKSKFPMPKQLKDAARKKKLGLSPTI